MLSEREQNLMYEAFCVGFGAGIENAENGYPNNDLNTAFAQWLEETVADKGGTVSQLLDNNYKEDDSAT